MDSLRMDLKITYMRHWVIQDIHLFLVYYLSLCLIYPYICGHTFAHLKSMFRGGVLRISLNIKSFNKLMGGNYDQQRNTIYSN